jgi:hypothetical protein
MRNLTVALAAGAIAVSAIAAPATAADITTFTSENVKAIIAEAGGTNISQETIEGTSFTRFEMGGMPFTYSTHLCDKKTGACIGLMMAIGFQMETTYSLSTINGFNKTIPFATAVQIDANKIGFGRFITSAGGIGTDNVKTNMGLHMIAPQLFMEYVKSEVVASADPAAAGKIAPVSMSTETPTASKAVLLSARDMNLIADKDVLNKLKLPK